MIIGIAGKARSGKSTVAEMFYQKLGFPIVAVADPLKKCCSQLFGIPLGDFYSVQKDARVDIHLTESQQKDFLDYVGLEYLPMRSSFESLRDMLQYLGTDIVRSHDPNFWLKQLEKQNSLIIADIRFTPEKEWVKNNNGILYYIDRDNIPIHTHVSEHQFNSLEGFTLIVNSGSLKDLEKTVERLIKKGRFYEKI